MVHRRITTWNSLLPARLARWLARSGCTARLLSAYDTFSRIYASPDEYGFSKADPGEVAGGIWVDGLHPTKKVQGTFGKGFEALLAGLADGLWAVTRDEGCETGEQGSSQSNGTK